MQSRTKLDSIRFNYSFGDDKIDKNEVLKAFMTRNMEKRQFKRTPLNHELLALTQMIDDVQKSRILRESVKEVDRSFEEDPFTFMESLSP